MSCPVTCDFWFQIFCLMENSWELKPLVTEHGYILMYSVETWNVGFTG